MYKCNRCGGSWESGLWDPKIGCPNMCDQPMKISKRTILELEKDMSFDSNNLTGFGYASKVKSALCSFLDNLKKDNGME